MGADFTLAIIEKPKKLEKEVWRARFASLDPEDFMSMIDRFGSPYFTHEDDWDDDDVFMGSFDDHDGHDKWALESRERYLAHIREQASDLVDSIYRLAWVDPGRESGWIYLNDKEYLASGGMSWGDSPTDAYDLIVAWDIAVEYVNNKSSSS